MDKATIGGLAMGSGLLILSIMIAPGANFAAFIDYPSAAVVLGGAIAASCIAFPIKTLLLVPKVLKKPFVPRQQPLASIIEQLVKYSEIARREGILALESATEEIEDSFVKMCIQMAIDGTDAETMERILRSEIEAVAQSHRVGKLIMDTLGRYAPAFRMVGTLIGLIIMLGNMDDPEAIGPGMAVALITTLYGAIFANLFCLPFADKLAFTANRNWKSAR